MPNDLTAKRNLFNRRADAPTSQRQKLVSSGFTASIWTISGVVLAACSSTIEDIEEFLGLDDGGDGGGNALHVQRSPVQGARIYFDMNNDGMINAADITAQDEAFPQGFVTDAAGRAHNIPAVFHGLPFKAVLDGAIDADTRAELSGELRSIPNADDDHLLASPITEYIAEQADTAAEVVAEWLGLDTTTPLPPEQERMRDTELRAILTSANYQGGDARIETLAVYLAHTPSPDQDQITRILIGDTADPDNTLIVVSEDMVSSDAVTIGAHDSYVATIQAVSHAGGVGYRFVDADGEDTTISDFSINAQGVISFIGENPTTTTLHIEVSNNDASESEIVRVEVTVADAPRLDELPAGDETATIMENVAGAAGGGTALITGITTSATNPSWEISEANPAGQSAIADKFEIVSGTGDTFNLVLKAGEILNYDAIPGGVLNLHVWAEVGANDIRSNALALRIQVEEDPDEVAFSGSFTGIVAEDGNLVAQGTFSVENQPENEAVDVSSQGAFGELVLGDNGAWTYTLTNTNAEVDGLLTGQTLIDTATISVGGASQNIVIRINGANEDVRFVDGDGNRITSDVAENGIEIGANATSGVNLGDVVPEIRGLLPSNDDSNVVLADDMGGLFSLDSATGVLTFTGTAADIAGLGGSANLVLVLTAPASIGDEEVTLALSVNVINDVQNGPAEYAIDGDITAGSMLTVSETMADPDGVRGSVRYQWFRGDDFATGTAIGTGASTYDVVEADEGNSIGVRITYTDNSNENPETTIDVFASPVSFTGPAIADRTINLDEDTSSGSTVHFAVRAESEDDAGAPVGIANYMLLDANNMPTTTYRGFMIDSSSGDITLTGSLDYEDTNADGTRIILRVRATDMNSPAETATLTLTINVDDVNEHAPAFAQSAYTAEISESRTAADGTILEITATDADGTNNAVTYSITAGDPDDLFFIDPNSGEIRVANGAVLNYDTDPATTSYTLEITATDGDTNNPMTLTQDVIITLTDINDLPPTINIAASTDTGAVHDGDAAGMDTGIRVMINDDAMDSYQFTYIHTVGFADIAGFELRQVSGTIYGLYTSEVFDFDGFDEAIKNIGILPMTIGVRDTLADGSTTPESIIPVRITITDINDNAPSLTVTGTGTIAEISDTASATHPAIDVAGITLTTADADTGTYAVVEAGYFSTNDARFAVVAGADANDWTLQLKANAALDFETDNPITLTITLNDGTNPATTRDVTINIGNVDDGRAEYVVTQSGTELTVALVEPDPTSATYSGDPDGVAGGVSYRWFTTNNNGVTQTDITGITDTTSARLDVSTHTLMDGHIYGVAISYTDNANMAYTGDNAIIVLNSGVRFSESNYAISITDGAAPASVMIPDTSAMLTPPKTGVTITYDFDTDGNPGDYFSINPNTGALTLKAAVDYDTATDKSFTLTLKATPSDTDIKPTTATVTVTLVDENDNKPSLSVVGGINTATIIENAVDADVGISFTITDADAPATNGFTANSFDIAAGAGTNAATAAKFTIVQDGDDWDLRLKPGMSLDYETDGTTGTINLAITVNDGQASDAGLSDAETITITVTDLNDNPPTSSGESGTAMLTEADAVNTNTDTGFSFTLADKDTDAVNRHEFIILGNESSRFAFIKDGTTANQWNLVLLAGQTVDREADGASIMLNFQVTDGNNPPLTALSTAVAITDANDNNPTVTVAGTGAIDERISGNTATITATGITITIADADATAAHQSFALGTANFTVTDADGIDLTGWSVDDDGNGNWVLQYDNTATALSAETSGTISLRIWVDDDDSGNGGRVESGIFHLTVNNLDEGDASYAITGTTANNGMLSVALDTNNPDPDGLVAGSETYRWFILNSDDTIPAAGDTNGNIGATPTSSTLSLPSDVGNNVYGVVVTYRDNAGETEMVTVIASAVQFSQNTYTVSFNEATAKPTGDGVNDDGLVRVTASLNTDGNAKVDEYKFLKGGAGGMASSDDQGFTIGASGIINFKDSVFDFDNIADKTYTLTVRASYKSGETGIATVEITITDANDNTPTLAAVSDTTATIAENVVGADAGAISFTITDADADTTNNFVSSSFTITGGTGTTADTAAKFEVVKDGANWKLKVRDDDGATPPNAVALDRETDGVLATGVINLDIKVNDGVADSNVIAVEITVTDLNDSAPTSSGESGTATLIEAAAANTNTDTGYSFTIADKDTDAVNRHEFIILGNESNRFKFVEDGTTANQWNLVLLAGQTVDREMDGASIMLNFQVNDESNRPLTALSTTVAITDANEANPTVAITAIATTQQEGTVAAGGVNVASFAVTDADATAYARANVELSGDSRFEITGWDATAKTGTIRLKADAVLDYETAADRSITLTITATDPLDNSVTGTDTVTITVTDENDSAPTATTSGTASLTEADAVSTNTDTGFSITLADDDTDTVNQHAITIDDTTLATRFGFVKDGTTANQWNLVLLANQKVDREGDGETLTIAYTISDDTNTPITDSVDVSIIDANDEPTVIGATKVLWESPTVSGTIPEGSYTAGTEIARAIVSDDDAGANLEYRLTKGGSTFSIGSTDGIITFTADTDLDADTAPTSYTLAYEVRDRNGAWESSGDITLTVTGIDDEKPELGTLTWQTGTGSGVAGEEHIRTINEDQGASPILVMSVSDPDTATASLTPTIQGGSPVDASNNPIFSFGILNNQAILSVLSSRLDHETAPNTYTLTLVVTDGTRTDTETVTINVGDINDNAPDIVVADSTPSVTARTASADTDIITGITVTDADVGKTYAQGDFELTGDSKFKFVWDATAQTGKVVLIDGQEITAGTISLSLTVTDANPVGHAGTDTETLTITVTELVNGGTTGTAMQYDPSAADASGTLTYIDAAQVKANPVAGDYTATGATYGTATVDASGTWTYNVDNTNAMVKGLASGATLTDTFTISVPLAAGGTGDVDVTVTITGVTVVEGTANADTGAAPGNPVNRAAATTFEVIHGSDHNDVITVGAEGAVVFGGYGDDTINLRNGKTDIVVYRFSSIDGGSWRADDGGDIINNFERGRDIFILVDDDATPIDDLDTLLSRDTTPFVPDTIVALNDKPKFTGPLVDSMFGQLEINFLAVYDVDGPGTLTTPPTGENVFINFVNKVSLVGAVTQGLVNDDSGDGHDNGSGQITDFSNVPNWLTTDVDTHVGLVVMSADQLAIDIL